MAARPGEENVATLFADVHYIYSPADVKPQHHRFDKGSYVYLFENAGERRCRIEIANNPGSDDQDAFYGFLDQTHVRYSYNQICTVSLFVAQSVDQSEWHLPTYDPRNENKYHYKLHALDIYFWTQKDALQFINGVRRVLPATQVEVLDEPPPPPRQQPSNMSAVVQKLENAAISDPHYGTAPAAAPQAAVQATAAVQAAAPGSSGTPSNSLPPPPPPPASFTPMAYNPAAPAAPESIRHREKTPPPDEDPLNPLAVAVAYDYQKQPFTPGLPPPSHFPPSAIGSPGFPPPPQFGGPPSHASLQRAATMPAHAGLSSPGLGGTYGAGFPASPGLPPPPPGQPPAQTAPPAQQALPAPPPGGYSTYSYSQQSHTPQGPADYSVHQQAYRPTEGEAHGGHKAQPYQPKSEVRGKIEENAGRLERGVSGMLKKFEKKFG